MGKADPARCVSDHSGAVATSRAIADQLELADVLLRRQSTSSNASVALKDMDEYDKIAGTDFEEGEPSTSDFLFIFRKSSDAKL